MARAVLAPHPNAGILDMEPPDHTRVRRLVSKAFTPKIVEGLRPRDRSGSWTGSSTRWPGAGEFDLIADVAEPLPVTVIAEMLGVPSGPPPPSAVVRGHLPDVRAQPVRGRSSRAVRAQRRVLRVPAGALASASATPATTSSPRWRRSSTRARRLTEDELIGTCVLLLNAGHEATVNVDRQRLVGAVPKPGPARVLRADRSLLPTRDRGAPAVRHAAADVRTLGARGRRARTASRSRRAPSSVCSSARPTTTPRYSTGPTSWTSRASRTRTWRSGRGSTSAWERRSRAWSSRLVPHVPGRSRTSTRRRAPMEAELHHPRPRGPAGPPLTAPICRADGAALTAPYDGAARPRLKPARPEPRGYPRSGAPVHPGLPLHPLLEPVVVAAFDGWRDAAGASTAAAERVADGADLIAVSIRTCCSTSAHAGRSWTSRTAASRT